MNDNYNFLEALRAGRNTEDLVAELTKALNEAEDQYRKEKAEEEKKKAEALAAEKKKAEAAKNKKEILSNILDLLAEYLVYADLDDDLLDELNEAKEDDETLGELVEMLDGVIEMTKLTTALGKGFRVTGKMPSNLVDKEVNKILQALGV